MHIFSFYIHIQKQFLLKTLVLAAILLSLSRSLIAAEAPVTLSPTGNNTVPEIRTVSPLCFADHAPTPSALYRSTIEYGCPALPGIPLLHPYDFTIDVLLCLDRLPYNMFENMIPPSLLECYGTKRPQLSLSMLTFPYETENTPVLSRSHHALHTGAGQTTYDYAVVTSGKALNIMKCSAHTHAGAGGLIASPNSGAIGTVGALNGHIVWGLTNKTHLACHLILDEQSAGFIAKNSEGITTLQALVHMVITQGKAGEKETEKDAAKDPEETPAHADAAPAAERILDDTSPADAGMDESTQSQTAASHPPLSPEFYDFFETLGQQWPLKKPSSTKE